MYTKLYFSWKRFFKGLWKPIVFITFYSSLVQYLHSFHLFENATLPLSVVSILGTAISLLLGFITNAAYNRWWEARKLWGAIVNESRTLIRQATAFFDNESENKAAWVQNLANQQIAWCYVLQDVLRSKDTSQDLKDFLDAKEVEFVLNHSNQPMAIQKLQTTLLAKVFKEGTIDTYQFTTMDGTIAKLCDSMGGCERIKNTIFPIQYGFFTNLAIFMFMLLLPFALVQPLGIYAIPITILVVFFFFMIDGIAQYMQDPFENRRTDIPMLALSRTVQRDLMALSDQTNIPPPLKPDDRGILI